jgi:diadenylate cyclase
LHDGAVIFKNERIEAARCLLPLSEPEKIRNKNLGTRHRAGIGITEISDAVSIIISEERKVVSVAEDGKLTFYNSIEDLKLRLVKSMGKASVASSVKNIFSRTGENDFEDSEDIKGRVDEEELKKARREDKSETKKD